MTKQGFMELLQQRGYTLETSTAGVPTVLCDTASIKKVSRELSKLTKESGYPCSFGVKGNTAVPESAEDAEDIADAMSDETTFTPEPESSYSPESVSDADSVADSLADASPYDDLQDYEQMNLF